MASVVISVSHTDFELEGLWGEVLLSQTLRIT